MFISLSIRNSPLNKKIDITFQEGLNVLKGKNSSGKSTILEYLNYSLFGSIALRSPTSTYNKDFSVECTLVINKILYKVVRLTKDASLYIFDTETNSYQILVTGITPVNTYLKELLTYDYKIFSLTNFCKQHELLKLTSSSPTELVNLIEVVSGLDSSYRLLLSLKESRKESKTAIATLNSTINSTTSIKVNFEVREDFESLLKEDEDVLRNLNRVVIENNELFNTSRSLIGNLERLSGQLRAKSLELLSLEAQLDTNVLDIDSNLEDHLKLDTEISSMKRTLSTFKPITESYTEDFLLQQESLLIANQEFQAYTKLRTELESKSVTCPECFNKFIPNSSEQVLEDSLIAPEKPQLTKKAIDSYRLWLSRVEEFNALEKSIELAEAAKERLIPKVVLITQKSLHKNILDIKNNILNIEKNIKDIFDEGLVLGIDLSEDSLENLLKDLENKYLESKNVYQEFQDYINLKTQEMHYQEVTTVFKEKLDHNTSNLKTYNLLLEVLNSVKKTIQQESFPVINSIASDIMSQITGGERNQVVLTEDFKIEVDGADINTIEGSGKVITNLALRVALLSTFYKDTFLVCLFDEIDESLHEDRFSYMEESFHKLADQGYQLILTSHKDYSADNIIDMDTFKR